MSAEETELTFIRCPNCRSLVPAVATRCRMCGQLIEAGASATPSSTPASSEGASKKSRVRQRTMSVSDSDVQSVKESIDDGSFEPAESTGTFSEDKTSELLSATAATGGNRGISETWDVLTTSVSSEIAGTVPDENFQADDLSGQSEDEHSDDEFGDDADDDILDDSDAGGEHESGAGQGSGVVPGRSRRRRRRRRKSRNPLEQGASTSGASASATGAVPPTLTTPFANRSTGGRLSDYPTTTSTFEPEVSAAQLEPRKFGVSDDRGIRDLPRAEELRSKNGQEAVMSENATQSGRQFGGDQQQGYRPSFAATGEHEGVLVGWLVDFSRDPKGVAREIRSGGFFIGTEQLRGNDFVIKHESVSSPHVLVKVSAENGIMIQDLMSQRGTFIRRGTDTTFRPCHEPLLLENGDSLRVGSYELMVVLLPGQRKKTR